MVSNPVANSYARGLLGAVERDKLAAVATGLAQIAESLGGHAELSVTLRSAVLSNQVRLSIIDKLSEQLHAPTVLRALLRVMVEKGHFHLLPTVATAFERQSAEALGIKRADVRFARAAGESEKRAVADALEAMLGARVDVRASVDETLVGGFVARVGDIVFDGSIARQLAKLRTALLSAGGARKTSIRSATSEIVAPSDDFRK